MPGKSQINQKSINKIFKNKQLLKEEFELLFFFSIKTNLF